MVDFQTYFLTLIIIALMIVDSKWSDQAFENESSNSNETEEFHFFFVNDLDPSVLALHQQVIQFYFEATQIRKTETNRQRNTSFERTGTET